MVSKKEARQRLAAVPLFEDLSKHELDLLATVTKDVRHPEGAEIMSQGADGVGFHLILEGSVSVRRNGRSIATLNEGDFFGEMSLFDDGQRTATIVATAPVTTLLVTSWDFKPLVRHNPALAWKFLSHMARRLRAEQAVADAAIC